jgi:hypothetical protein
VGKGGFNICVLAPIKGGYPGIGFIKAEHATHRGAFA